jgi:hypothetical protein
MPSRSVKSFFRTFVSLALAAGFACPLAEATLTVVSANKGGTAGAVAYYGWTLDGSTPFPGDFDSGFSEANASEHLAVDPTLSEALLFNISSNFATAVPAGKRYVIAVSTNTGNDSENYLVPIASPCGTVGGTECHGPVAFTFGGVSQPNRYVGVQHTPNIGQTQQIAIYPMEICAAAVAWGKVTPDECDGTTSGGDATIEPTATSTRRIRLMFTLQQLADESTATLPIPYDSSPATGTILESAEFGLNFQAAPPTVSSCTVSGADIAYFPSEGEIKVDTSQFGMTISPATAAPRTVVLVRGLDIGSSPGGSLPVTSPSFEARVPASGEQAVGPLIDSTEAEAHYYSMSFLMRDAAGILVSDPACGLLDVQSAEIRGFLKKSRCFVATAAFGSMDAAPVEMLRDFRDGVLARFALGRAFTRWYYGWSPDAANWLLDHPLARLPVLLLLLPLQAFAWLALNPLSWLLLTALGTGAAFALLRPWAARART